LGGSWGAIVWAGFVAGILAACVFWLFRTFDWTQYTPTRQLGCLLYDDPRLPMAETVGFALFLLLCATVMAAAYALVLGALGGPGWGSGMLAGAVHGAGVAAALPYLSRASRCVTMGRLPPPGRFGLGWGRATPAAVTLGYAVYGGVFGAVLAGF
jgi:hypothetical protein